MVEEPMVDKHGSGTDAQARIDRMVESGLISPRQAEQLRAGLGAASIAGHGGREASSRKRVPLVVATAIVLLVFLLFTFLPGGGPAELQNTEVQDVASTLNQPGTVGVMNKFLSVSIAIFILVVVPVVIVAASYNGLVSKEEAVLTSWGQVESQFQRRADLVPALVETVTRYMAHERDTLNEITAQRRPDLDRLAEAVDRVAAGQEAIARAAGQDDSVIEDQAALTRLFAGSTSVGREITGLIAVVEDYPELASSDQFLELQAQLEGTENRINVARLRFNEAVGAYNGAMRRIPGNLAAALGGFKRKAYFRAEEGSDEAEETLFE